MYNHQSLPDYLYDENVGYYLPAKIDQIQCWVQVTYFSLISVEVEIKSTMLVPYFLANVNFCHLPVLIIFAICWPQHFVGPDLNPNCMTRIIVVFLKDLKRKFWKVSR